MPLKRSKSRQESLEREGRLLLAKSAIQKQEISSIRDVARRFEVPELTLRSRLRGIEYRVESRANGYKLTNTKEESLVQ